MRKLKTLQVCHLIDFYLTKNRSRDPVACKKRIADSLLSWVRSFKLFNPIRCLAVFYE